MTNRGYIVRVRWRTKGKTPAQWTTSEVVTRRKAEQLAARVSQNPNLEVKIDKTQIARACEAIWAATVARENANRASRRKRLDERLAREGAAQ